MILLESVTLNDGTIYNETKGWRLLRAGDTVLIGTPETSKASGFSKVLHLPWAHVRESLVKENTLANAAMPEGYASLMKYGQANSKMQEY